MILGLHGLHCNYVIIDLTLTCSCVCMYVCTYVCMYVFFRVIYRG